MQLFCDNKEFCNVYILLRSFRKPYQSALHLIRHAQDPTKFRYKYGHNFRIPGHQSIVNFMCGYMATWLHGYVATWLHGSSATGMILNTLCLFWHNFRMPGR